LVLCYNRALAGRLKKAVDSWGFEPGQVRATYFHQLCEEAFGALGETFKEPLGNTEAMTFYNHEAPDRLRQALEKGLLPKWDAIVVDEGQDFVASWWHIIEAKLSDPSAGRHFVFYDPFQGIFGRECTVPPLPQLRLSTCVRSTRRITEYAATLGDPTLRPHRRSPEGSPVEFIQATSEEECRKALADVVQRLLTQEGVAPSQIAILSPHRLEHSSLAGITKLAGIPLKAAPNDDDGAIPHATISGFKGLEADVIILVDINPGDPRCDRSALYVAASRARHRLFILGRG
jgi:superfamily I DNA/RNA helicase